MLDWPIFGSCRRVSAPVGASVRPLVDGSGQRLHRGDFSQFLAHDQERDQRRFDLESRRSARGCWPSSNRPWRTRINPNSASRPATAAGDVMPRRLLLPALRGGRRAAGFEEPAGHIQDPAVRCETPDRTLVEAEPGLDARHRGPGNQDLGGIVVQLGPLPDFFDRTEVREQQQGVRMGRGRPPRSSASAHRIFDVARVLEQGHDHDRERKRIAHGDATQLLPAA